MYSPVSLLFYFYPLPAMHSLLVTLNVAAYLIGINQRLINVGEDLDFGLEDLMLVH